LNVPSVMLPGRINATLSARFGFAVDCPNARAGNIKNAATQVHRLIIIILLRFERV